MGKAFLLAWLEYCTFPFEICWVVKLSIFNISVGIQKHLQFISRWYYMEFRLSLTGMSFPLLQFIKAHLDGLFRWPSTIWGPHTIFLGDSPKTRIIIGKKWPILGFFDVLRLCLSFCPALVSIFVQLWYQYLSSFSQKKHVQPWKKFAITGLI